MGSGFDVGYGAAVQAYFALSAVGTLEAKLRELALIKKGRCKALY